MYQFIISWRIKKFMFTFANASYICYWISQPQPSLSTKQAKQEHLNLASENSESKQTAEYNWFSSKLCTSFEQFLSIVFFKI